MVDLDSLNKAQRQVVLEQGNCLAISCPGSGKTTTLAKKVAYLLEQGRKVAAVTFTREAALELRGRAASMAPQSTHSNLIVGTFHSMCMYMSFPERIGRQFGRNILREMKSPFRQPWKIVDGAEQNAYILAAVRESGLSINLKDATSLIEEWKAKPLMILDDQQRIIVEKYAEQMRHSGKIDFQDMILKANQALDDSSMSPLPVDHLLIDEFQDTDATQYEWIRHHGDSNVILTAVGDDDQSIYAFRRALGYDVMNDFVRDFKARRILLGENYRCHSEILCKAGELIANNSKRISKDLVAAKGPGGDVFFCQFDTEEEEAEEVVSAGKKALKEGASFTVIARTHRELLEIQRVCIVEDIPFIAERSDSIFNRFEVLTFGAIARFLCSPDPSDLDHIMNWAQMDIDDRNLVRNSFRLTTAGTLDCASLINGVSDGGRSIWRMFGKRYLGWISTLESEGYFLLLGGILEWMEMTAPQNTSREVIRIAHDIYHPRDGEFRSHVAHIQDKADRFRHESDRESDIPSINLITAHAAKGLEYDRVWIIGLVEGGFPSDRSPIEEERRLMYVAMTRAKNVLTVSSIREKKTSPFVFEAALADDISKPKADERKALW